LFLGHLSSKRDWRYAPEYVEAMWMMLQQDKPEDFVIATGESHSVEEIVEMSFELVGLDWRNYVAFDERYVRPLEVDELCGDPSMAKQKLGWAPRTSFRELIQIMLEHDLKAVGLEAASVLTVPAIKDGRE
jgi:GDPmannose 4,6-dehydratase